VKGLWSPGLGANILAVAAREPVRNGCYPLVRDILTDANGGQKSPGVMFASGYICGSLGSVTRLQHKSLFVCDGVMV
jgi:hypothetical protein